VGIESDWVLKILERAAIKTMILPKGYVATGSELWGENQCGLKPLLATPQSHAYVRSSPEVTCKKGIMEKELAPETIYFKIERRGCRYHRTCTKI
jgi:hypothetical protein